MGSEGEQQRDLALVGFIARPLRQNALVGAVECDDEVILGERVGRELTGAVSGAVVAAACERVDRALISVLADVPISGAGTARDDAAAESAFLHQLAEDDLCHRGAADVACAHEDDAKRVRIGHCSIIDQETDAVSAVSCTEASVHQLCTHRGQRRQ